MTSGQDLDLFSFIKSRFGSVWSLEIFLALHSSPERDWTIGQLVERVRGSETVVTRGVGELLKADLAISDERGDIRFAAHSEEAALLAEPLTQLYRRTPEGVRRLIGNHGGCSTSVSKERHVEGPAPDLRQYFTVTLRKDGEMGWYRFGAMDRQAALTFVSGSEIFSGCEIIRVHSLGSARPSVMNSFEYLPSRSSQKP